MFHWIVTFAAAILGAAALWRFAGLDIVLSWFAACTVVAFLTYGYDKAIAGSGWRRIPEKLLLAIALAGGTIGAFVGMQVFRHKTAKESFRIRFWLVVIVQGAAIAAYWAWGSSLHA